ncbi:MAG TPA: helicase HerA-like domain-containing protein [Myxococcota bacterium]|nr:helicase HerA-like domain-containing protein [Myxococcota bacterium]
MTAPLRLARAGDTDLELLPALANRHGCITGATGTGKTVTVQRLAEGFSQIGVPVFVADVKGDLAGIAEPGQPSDKIAARLDMLKLPAPAWAGCPVALWDVWGEQGHPVRATISEMGPLLLARLLMLNETQQGVLALTFKIADDNGLLLLDLKDLRAMLQFVGENAAKFTTEYGNVSAASIGAIQRALLQIEGQGGDRFFGEPVLNIDDLLQTSDGKGVVNVLAADKLIANPRLYATFLLWLLSELFEKLPEVGDPEKPKLVFFFDEAHLLFSEAPAPLLEKVEQVVRLIRSKGVGVYFATQSPLDIPDKVLGQLGNRVQHALRAFTARDKKAVSAAADTMRPNPKLDLEAAIGELAVGEALISLLDAKGAPSVTERAWVIPPASRIGPLTPDERKKRIAESPVAGVYEKAVDRESAFELLKQRAGTQDAPATGRPSGQAPAPAGGGVLGELGGVLFGSTGPRGGRRDGLVDAFAKSAARSIGSTVARQITRGVLGSLLGGRR